MEPEAEHIHPANFHCPGNDGDHNLVVSAPFHGRSPLALDDGFQVFGESFSTGEFCNEIRVWFVLLNTVEQVPRILIATSQESSEESKLQLQEALEQLGYPGGFEDSRVLEFGSEELSSIEFCLEFKDGYRRSKHDIPFEIKDRIFDLLVQELRNAHPSLPKVSYSLFPGRRRSAAWFDAALAAKDSETLYALMRNLSRSVMNIYEVQTFGDIGANALWNAYSDSSHSIHRHPEFGVELFAQIARAHIRYEAAREQGYDYCPPFSVDWPFLRMAIALSRTGYPDHLKALCEIGDQFLAGTLGVREIGGL